MSFSEGFRRCVMCDFASANDKTFRFDKVADGFVCPSCRSWSYYDRWDENNTSPLGEASNIHAMLEEMERRFPDLFVGPVCPRADFLCDCTYESGCKALRVDKSAAGVRTDNKVPVYAEGS